jgi:23S rRNA pseudouridine955/2504/2580 synthase/23S rRNA pseudouridine1911/1915/1917 synthase
MQISKYILFENDDYLVLHKPAGLLSIPDRHNPALANLAALLEQRYGEIFVVHRLDRNTSGVMVFARHAAAHKFLSAQFQERTTEKMYLALVQGRVWESEGTIDSPIAESSGRRGKMIISPKGKPALTTFEVLEPFNLYTLLKIRLHTGRTHQIRVHMQSIGHPIAGDELYGDGKPFYLSFIKKQYRLSRDQQEERPLMSRTALHALSLGFSDEKGQRHFYEAPLPKDFRAVLSQLQKHARIA